MEEVLFAELAGKHGKIGVITLNRPQVLNALSHAMCLAMDKALVQWANDSLIQAVVIQAAPGRAFCAGGDIRSAHDHRDQHAGAYFEDEYRLDARVFHFPKPYIALMDGITMGGGVGVSLHGKVRIATENFLFAMPETGIGFYPDIGASYYLARMPHGFGMYLGLTGARLNAHECLALGLVDKIILSHDVANVIPLLQAEASLTRENILQTLQAYAEPQGEALLLQHTDQIKRCFLKNSVEEILHALQSEQDEWCHVVHAELMKKSPLSLKVTHQQLRRAAHLDFDACMAQDARLTARFMRDGDFFEGVRAVIIDKDQKPRWSPASLELVRQETIEAYFAGTEELR